jgi:hypothetical protein
MLPEEPLWLRPLGVFVGKYLLTRYNSGLNLVKEDRDAEGRSLTIFFPSFGL